MDSARTIKHRALAALAALLLLTGCAAPAAQPAAECIVLQWRESDVNNVMDFASVFYMARSGSSIASDCRILY